MTTPTLLLLPGLDGTGVTSEPFVEHLGGRVRPVRITYPPRPHRSRAELAEIVLGQFPTGDPVVVLGESFSTAVAVTVAARAPDVVGLILVTPCFAARVRWLLRLLPPWVPAVLPPPAVLRWMLTGGRGPAADLLARALAGADPGVLLRRVREYLANPTADDPAGVGVPVLVIRAARDRLLQPSPGEPQPGVERVTLDAPHLVLASLPAVAADIVVRFTERVAGRAL